MNKKLRRKLANLTLACILITSGVPIATPNTIPAAEAANTNLFVSAVSSKFNDTFAGPQVVEVVVNDNNIKTLDDVHGEPDVTVNGKKLRMAQATDGNWYGYFASKAQAVAADRTVGLAGFGLDFGEFCSAGSTGLGATFTDTVGIVIAAAGAAGATDGTGNIDPEPFASCTAGPTGPRVNNVVRENKTLNKAAPSGLNGQIRVDDNAWPVIQLYDFVVGGNVNVTYNKGGGPEVIMLTFDTIPFDVIETLLDKSIYSPGSDVRITIADPQLNIDPTDEDSWTWSTRPGNVKLFYQAFNEDGSNDATFKDGKFHSLAMQNLIGNLSEFMFVKNGKLEINLAAKNGFNIATLGDNNLQIYNHVLFTSIPAPMTFKETTPKSGVFENFDESDNANLDILKNPPKGMSATIKYNNVLQNFTTSEEGKYTILFKTGPITPNPPPEIDAIKDGLNQTDTVHFLVQFTKLPNVLEKQDIADQGITLLNYIGGNAYLASAKVMNLHNLDTMPEVRWAGPFNGKDKISHSVTEGNVGTWAITNDGRIVLMIVFHKDVNLVKAEDIVVNQLGGQIIATVSITKTITASFDVKDDLLGKAKKIAAEDIVRFVDIVPPPLQAANDGAREATKLDLISSTELRGEGVKIMVYDDGHAAMDHPDLIGSIIREDPDQSHLITSPHATHVAGTLVGSGAASMANGAQKDRQWAGMAPAAKIYSYNTDGDDEIRTSGVDLRDDLASVINDPENGVDLTSMSLTYGIVKHSLSINLLGDYDPIAAFIDGVVTGSLGQKMIFVEAAGNERTAAGSQYYTMSPPATAKNSIAVGAINSNDNTLYDLTSFGPTDDGRLKPDIVAPGCQTNGDGGIKSTSMAGGYVALCGTSMATPVVAGATALLTEKWRTIFTSEPRPLPHTVKAILVHTATDLNYTGPDYTSGWGALNAKSMIDLINGIGKNSIIQEDQINEGEDQKIIPFPAKGIGKMRATLVWDDPPHPEDVTTLSNDLDLVLYDPLGNPYYPFVLNPSNPKEPAHHDRDEKNNVEMAVGPKLPKGIWTATITGTTMSSSQEFTVIISEAIPGPGEAEFEDNHVPSITSIPITTATVNAQYTYHVEASDEDPGDTLTFSLLQKPSGMTIGSTSGVILWTPSSQGSPTVKVKVADAESDSTQLFTINVTPSPTTNHAPSITTVPATPYEAEIEQNRLWDTFTVSATDLDGDPQTFSLNTAPPDMTIDSISGRVSWTPTAANSVKGDTYPFIVRVTDGELDATKTFQVKVGGCLIATATYGSPMAPQVQALRELRDGTVLKTASGSAFMTGFNAVYYSFAPIVAGWEDQNPAFKEAVKIAITPLLSTLSILNYVDINSEAEMLAYGISVIVLNIGMYFVAPAFIIMRLRDK